MCLVSFVLLQDWYESHLWGMNIMHSDKHWPNLFLAEFQDMIKVTVFIMFHRFWQHKSFLSAY